MNKLLKPCTPLLAALLLGALSAPDVQAQIGLKAGTSHGSISNSGLLPGDIGSRTGFAAGVSFATTPQVLGFGVDVLYAQRGAAEPNNPSSRELDFLDIPIYLRLMAPAQGIAPFAYAGPQVSFEVDCSTIDEDCPDTGRSSTTYAGTFGAGVRLGGERAAFTVEARYVYGLSDLEFGTVTDEDNYRDRSFLILAGISF